MTASTDPLLALWHKPPAAYRGKPFWSWNGQLDKDELVRQLHIFKEMGMGGAFLHSRTGLKTEYLGPEWFDCINACADEAERLGLEAWLYDEDRWPSGSAGGLATADPAYRMKCLRLTVVPPGTVTPSLPGPVLAVFRAEVDGLRLGRYEGLDEMPAEAPAKDSLLIFNTETIPENSFYNGNTYLDTLKREATEHFIGITHERYRQNCGDRLGRSIKGIFTDEPHHGLVMCAHPDDGEDLPPESGRAWTVPWTESLFEDFNRRWDYDLCERLPELFLQKDGDRLSPVKWQYMELLQQSFLENWARPCLEWCRKHGLLLTGHVLHEDSMVAQAVPCGSVMRYYEFMDYPGIDILGNDNLSYWVAKQLQSAARQMGKQWLLSELYGCSGWQFDFAGHREIGAWQALLGINLRCHHLSWVSMAGEAKRDYPGSISFQSGWYPDYHYVEDFFSRIHVLLGEGEPLCHVLWINPVESAWAQIHPGWARWLEAADPHLKDLQARHDRLFRALLSSGVDFDYGDEDHIARFGSVESGSDETPRLRIKAMAYRVVIVSAMESLRRSTLERLREFRSTGGTVLCIGPAPTHLEGGEAKELQVFFDSCTTIDADDDSLAAALHHQEAGAIRIENAKKQLLSQVRRTSRGSLCCVLNTDAAEPAGTTRFHLPGAAAQVQRWGFLSGDRSAVPFRVEDGHTVWEADLEAGEICAFLAAGDADPDIPDATPSPRFTNEEHFAEPLHYRLDEPNLCLLDRAEWRLDNGPWQDSEYLLHIDAKLRNHLGMAQRSGTMVQPWARKPKSRVTRDEPTAPLLCLRFRFDIETLPKTAELIIEGPEGWDVSVNGTAVRSSASTGWFIDPALRRLPLEPGTLRAGRNTIEITAPFTEETDIESLYLAGPFAVRIDDGEPVIGRLPEKLRSIDICRQGLPFYSGAITYSLPVPPAMRTTSLLRLETGKFGGALAKASGARPILWAPYATDIIPDTEIGSIELTVQLTRVNTFGPHHQSPKEQSHIGPSSFRTTGTAFDPEYQLWPAGLLQPPVLRSI